MKLSKVALIGAGIALIAGTSMAQDATSAAPAPAQAAPESQSAADEADPVVCRRQTARTNSRLQRRGDRRCLRRSEWESLRKAAEDSAVAAQGQQGAGRN